MLFVYGTLRSGGGQNWRLADRAALIGMARMAGRLYRVNGYPGFPRSSQSAQRGEWVLGELYCLSDSDDLLAELDCYEGNEYTRERGLAVMGSDAAVDCWVYVYRGPVDEARRIQSGDFLA